MTVLKVKRASEDIKLPTRATPGSSCYDVYTPERMVLTPGEVWEAKTGLFFEIPSGYGLEVRPRSSMALKGTIILNSPGTIDSDYRGELIIIIVNIMGDEVRIEKGDRIAQIKLSKVLEVEFEEVDSLDKTERNKGGFGSTGR